MDPILLGKGITDDVAVTLLPKLGNRHGLVAGATGTGKTVTLQGIAESFSAAGVPVFLADVKGDVSGLAVPGAGGEKLLQRAQEIGVSDYAPAGSPAITGASASHQPEKCSKERSSVLTLPFDARRCVQSMGGWPCPPTLESGFSVGTVSPKQASSVGTGQ